MKMQISFDLTDLEKAIELAKNVESHADIFEIGTLLLYKYGVEAVKLFKETFPQKSFLVDTKIVDRARESIAIFEPFNIQFLTVMAEANKDTLQTACAHAQNAKIKLMLDLSDSHTPGQSAMEAKTLGFHGLIIHNTEDHIEPMTLIEKWEMVRGNTNLPIFIGGKINRQLMATIHTLKPEGVIVGSAILKAQNAAAEASYFYEECQK